MGELILVVDDEPDVADVVERMLAAEGFETAVARNGDEAIAAVRELHPDLVLLDVMMPGVDGVAVCRQLRDDPATSSVAIIMLTAKAMPADRVLGLTSGADDYIAKPFDVDELLARIRSALRRQSQLRGLSPLTGLPGNFDIVNEIDALLEAGRPFAVLYVDLDDFKAFNDYYGFIRGDDAIRALADVLVDVVRDTATEVSFLGHVGGDDFVVICDEPLATTVADAVVAGFDAAAPALYEPEDQLLGYIEVEDRLGMTHRYRFLTVSIGIAVTTTHEFQTSAEVASVATEMKQLAKSDPGSSWRIDRRRG